MKIKDEKQKHNHKLTELLKICIFGLLMIAPLLASVSQMLYVTLNKNAKDSYYGETINQSESVFTDKFKLGETYYLNWTNSTTTYVPSIPRIKISNIELSTNRTDMQTWFDANKNSIVYFNFNGTTNDNSRINFYDENYLYLNNFSYTNYIVELSFIPEADYTINFNNYFYYIKYNNYTYLDNAFYYGVDQMTQSDLFNWTQNTAIYTGVKAMTDNLQIQTPAIAILIVYWFILTIIYVIIDIVLKCFTTITHMIFRAD